MSRVRPLASAAGAALALLLASCSSEAPPAPPPPEVNIVTIRTQAVPNVIELPGRVQAYRTSEVRARVDGIVERRLFNEGSFVRAGAALFRIDPRQLTATANAARAQLARAQATAANARQVVGRYQPLLADQAIGKQEYDAAVAAQRTAEADVQQAQANLESARLNLGYSMVTAPISGRARRAEVTEGALVSAGQGTLLTTIEQIDRVYVNFGQSSSDLLATRREMGSGKVSVPQLERVEVQLILEDGTAFPVVGHLDFLDLSIDEATGTAALRAEFPNPNSALLPGQFVRARIFAGNRADGMLIPQRAVKLAADTASVMVLDAKNIATPRPVKLGTMVAGQWAILDGLKPGDRVIVDGLQKVQPGQPVRVAQPKGTASTPAAKR
ncbi:multidrug transporter [Sphingopyxis sp. Root214]|uniref:efflux RND transporter periplasmic adaptor subunit n=1 Tax=unclassified Sphingopyxis TaxID=2614943 RepID=UPI0006F6B734|nr:MULTISPECIES: efflux RND transporter periplasmic adaptor subunit [unclassified Sphingopyxis]KQZ71365.1 multidrug transporter [Sphingopyxis sp. Root154]KRC05273.1 multidrug transporter [Sphingopyxis sp. Root214]